ncbi:MAG: hypothetical protein ACR2PR_08965 [Pseudohongiellaceae bacterium]
MAHGKNTPRPAKFVIGKRYKDGNDTTIKVVSRGRKELSYYHSAHPEVPCLLQKRDIYTDGIYDTFVGGESEWINTGTYGCGGALVYARDAITGTA